MRQARNTTSTGTGSAVRMIGKSNQRARNSGIRNGMMALTSPMKPSVSRANTRASRRACSCSSPSVFHTSQHAPSSP